MAALEGKIPPGDVTIPFKWKDAFDRGSLFSGKLHMSKHNELYLLQRADMIIAAMTSLAYERVCVLFNMAALQTQIAANQDLQTDDGLKLGAQMFQAAAGIFTQLRASVITAIQRDPTPDLGQDSLAALAALCIAQAQELFSLKAMQDKMKPTAIVKLCAQSDSTLR